MFTAPIHSGKERRYSLSWAKSVVKRALEDHARVSNSFLESTQLTPDDLANYLSHGAPEWPILRDMLKWLDACQQRPQRATQMLRYYVNYYAVRFPAALRKHLTGALDIVDLKSSEQAEGGQVWRQPDLFALDLSSPRLEDLLE